MSQPRPPLGGYSCIESLPIADSCPCLPTEHMTEPADSFKNAVAGMMGGGDGVEVQVEITAFTQSAEASMSLGGFTAADLDSSTEAGRAALAQVLAGVAASLGVNVEDIAMGDVSRRQLAAGDGGDETRRLQLDLASIAYGVTAGMDISSLMSSPLFGAGLAGAISGAGDLLTIDPSAVTAPEPAVSMASSRTLRAFCCTPLSLHLNIPGEREGGAAKNGTGLGSGEHCRRVRGRAVSGRLTRWVSRRLCPVFLLHSWWLRHHLSPVCSTAFAAKTAPLPCASTRFAFYRSPAPPPTTDPFASMGDPSALVRALPHNMNHNPTRWP